ncbi:MAG: hypothetical protein AAGH48_02135 [Pseudomonadota bacterium]
MFIKQIFTLFAIASCAPGPSVQPVRIGEFLTGDILMTEDPTVPTEIEHLVEYIIVDGQLEERYNHIVYSFQAENSHISARTYLDEIDTVSVFGPFGGPHGNEKISDDEHFDNVLGYLKRRFFRIDVLGDSDTGYVTIWPERAGPSH